MIDAPTWSIAGGITQPIFFGGEPWAAVQDIRTSEQKLPRRATLAIQARAFGDVEDALAGDYYLRKREGALSTVVENSSTSVKLGGEQLEQGQIDTFTTLRLAGENLAAKIELDKVRVHARERVTCTWRSVATSRDRHLREIADGDLGTGSAVRPWSDRRGASLNFDSHCQPWRRERN